MSAPPRKERWPAALGLPLGRAALEGGGAGKAALGLSRWAGQGTLLLAQGTGPVGPARGRSALRSHRHLGTGRGRPRRAKPKVTPRQSVPPRAALRAVWDCHTRPQGTRGQHRPWTYGRTRQRGFRSRRLRPVPPLAVWDSRENPRARVDEACRAKALGPQGRSQLGRETPGSPHEAVRPRRPPPHEPPVHSWCSRAQGGLRLVAHAANFPKDQSPFPRSQPCHFPGGGLTGDDSSRAVLCD